MRRADAAAQQSTTTAGKQQQRRQQAAGPDCAAAFIQLLRHCDHNSNAKGQQLCRPKQPKFTPPITKSHSNSLLRSLLILALFRFIPVCTSATAEMGAASLLASEEEPASREVSHQRKPTASESAQNPPLALTEECLKCDLRSSYCKKWSASGQITCECRLVGGWHAYIEITVF